MKSTIAACLICVAALPTLAQSPVYTNSSRSPDERAADLVKHLTLEEKVALMQNESPAIPRLGIKAYNWWNEALHGVARNGLATVFPQCIGLAATFDTDLVYNVFNATSDEARAKHAHALRSGQVLQYQGLTFWTPNINIFRDPRWGRGQETYGEDPFLTSAMGLSVVRGLQGPQSAKYHKLHACAKHFAVHSGPEWSRHYFNAENISTRDLYETYLPAFKALVQKGDVKEIMCAYNRYEGKPCCTSDRLLQQILRNDWGYQGIVLSDCGAIDDFYHPNYRNHQYDTDAMHASAHAVSTGTDLECGRAYSSLVEAVKSGLVDINTIDTSVTRLMKARFELGEMDTNVFWDSIPFSVVDSDKHRRLARLAAQKSVVLLQNRNHTLPLKQGSRIAVVGPNAADSIMQWANYNGFPSHTSTLLSALCERTPDAVTYIPLCSHYEVLSTDLAALADADVVIFAGGISPRLEGEQLDGVDIKGFRGGDREIIELPKAQTAVLQAIHNLGKPIVFVNFSGSAIALEKETALCDVILQAWYPGQAGGDALVDVIFGDYNPAGRLPVTFYASTDQLPDFQEYSMNQRTYRYLTQEPTFHFGHGLSYTSFSYGKAELSARAIKPGDSINITIPVTNTGDCDGEEVVQIYLRRPADTDGPSHALRAFKRVAIKKGSTERVSFTLDADFFLWYNPVITNMDIMPGDYEILFGGTSKISALGVAPISIVAADK